MKPSNLPPGVTERMLDPEPFPDPIWGTCERCGEPLDLNEAIGVHELGARFVTHPYECPDRRCPLHPDQVEWPAECAVCRKLA